MIKRIQITKEKEPIEMWGHISNGSQSPERRERCRGPGQRCPQPRGSPHASCATAGPASGHGLCGCRGLGLALRCHHREGLHDVRTRPPPVASRSCRCPAYAWSATHSWWALPGHPAGGAGPPALRTVTCNANFSRVTRGTGQENVLTATDEDAARN